MRSVTATAFVAVRDPLRLLNWPRWPTSYWASDPVVILAYMGGVEAESSNMSAARDQPLEYTAGSRGGGVSFWIVAALGLVASSIAWTWYGFAQFEAQSEQGKALSAGTTMAGFGELLGGLPLALAHFVGIATLAVLGWHAYRGRGMVLAIVAVLITSAIGIGVAQLLWAGELFQLGINNKETIVP